MHIAFFCLPEHGGYVPTFHITKRLLALGHRVTYYGPLDFEERVRNQGFDYVSLYPEEIVRGTVDVDAFPDGAVATIRHIRGLLRLLAQRGRWEALNGVADNALAPMLRANGVDLVLVDGLFNFIVPLIAASGIPYQVYLTELSGAHSRRIPPSYSGAIPGEGGALARLAIRLSWAQVLPKLLNPVMIRLLYIGLPQPPKPLLRRARQQIADSARRAGMQRSLWEYGMRWTNTEVVLCPSAFDFPEAREGRTYAGPCIDLERKDWSFPWDEFESRHQGRRIVLVSLGTHAAQYGGTTTQFLRKVFELASGCADLFFVVALGKGRSVDSIGVPPENVMAFSFLPQLDLLERASAMVTNGGLGTVKECIWFRVPMVVAPCNFDQPGNAARVVHHGIGRRVDVARVKVPQLQEAIRACLDDAAIARKIGAMSAAFRDSGEHEQWLAGIVSHGTAAAVA